MFKYALRGESTTALVKLMNIPSLFSSLYHNKITCPQILMKTNWHNASNVTKNGSKTSSIHVGLFYFVFMKRYIREARHGGAQLQSAVRRHREEDHCQFRLDQGCIVSLGQSLHYWGRSCLKTIKKMNNGDTIYAKDIINHIFSSCPKVYICMFFIILSSLSLHLTRKRG